MRSRKKAGEKVGSALSPFFPHSVSLHCPEKEGEEGKKRERREKKREKNREP